MTKFLLYIFLFSSLTTVSAVAPPLDEIEPPATTSALDDSTFLDLVQKTGIDFFWREANSGNGLIKDRSASYSPCSIASIGFGLTAICIGVDRGWIDRNTGRARILLTLQTMWHSRQGRDPVKDAGYKGFFYHMLDMQTLQRAGTSELSSIDSAILFMGALYVKQYFDSDDPADVQVRELSDSLYYRADWEWFRNFNPAVLMEWRPDKGFGDAQWRGYCEGMMLYILALGSPTHPVPATCWNTWTSGYQWQSHYSYSYVIFPPLFGHQYSHCWIDFRDIQDAYMRGKGIDYFENSRRATLAQRAYCIANPGKFPGYGENCWGITASDVQGGYMARGAPPAQNDEGTLAPTAPGGSMPFAPEICLPALRYMYDTYRAKIWGTYGFRDAFNIKSDWWDPDVIGIDQGCMVIMIENYRSGRVWKRFMKNADIQHGLQRAGFTQVSAVDADNDQSPWSYDILQNHPNPFNAETIFTYVIGRQGRVRLQIFDLAGQSLTTLVDEVQNAGAHRVQFLGGGLPSGVYLALLSTPDSRKNLKFTLIR